MLSGCNREDALINKLPDSTSRNSWRQTAERKWTSTPSISEPQRAMPSHDYVEFLMAITAISSQQAKSRVVMLCWHIDKKPSQVLTSAVQPNCFKNFSGSLGPLSRLVSPNTAPHGLSLDAIILRHATRTIREALVRRAKSLVPSLASRRTGTSTSVERPRLGEDDHHVVGLLASLLVCLLHYSLSSYHHCFSLTETLQTILTHYAQHVGTSIATRSPIGRSAEAGLPSSREGEERRKGCREEVASPSREQG